jgi:hypothetical protein
MTINEAVLGCQKNFCDLEKNTGLIPFEESARTMMGRGNSGKHACGYHE